MSGIAGTIIAVISNYELSLLAFFIDILYVIIKIYIIRAPNFININSFAMLICTGVVFGLATYSFPYMKFMHKFVERYKS